MSAVLPRKAVVERPVVVSSQMVVVLSWSGLVDELRDKRSTMFWVIACTFMFRSLASLSRSWRTLLSVIARWNLKGYLKVK